MSGSWTVSSPHVRAHGTVNRGNLCPCQRICAHAASRCARSPGLAALLGVRTAGRDAPGPLTAPSGPRGVSGVTHDSRRVHPGDLYAALPGSQPPRRAVLRAGRRRGRGGGAHRPGGQGTRRSGPACRCSWSPTRGRGSARSPSWVYGHPSGRLTLIGVTGTSGKTTTTYLLESGLRAAGHLTGLIGGVETRIGDVAGRQRADHPGGHRPAGAAGGHGGAGRDRGGDGGVQPRAGARPGGRHVLRRGRVHQPVPGSPGLPRRPSTTTSRPRPPCSPRGYARAGVVNIDDAHGRRLAAGPQIPVTTFSAGREPGRRLARGRRARRGGRQHVPGHRPRRRGGRRVGRPARAVQRRQRARRDRGAGRGGRRDLATAVAGVAACPGVPGPAGAGRRRARTSPCSSTTRTSRARCEAVLRRAAAGHRWAT